MGNSGNKQTSRANAWDNVELSSMDGNVATSNINFKILIAKQIILTIAIVVFVGALLTLVFSDFYVSSQKSGGTTAASSADSVTNTAAPTTTGI